MRTSLSSRVLSVLDRVDACRLTVSRRLFFPSISWPWGRKVADYALRQVDGIQPQVIIATHPFPGTLRAAAILSQRTGLPWVADMRDPFHNDPQLGDDRTRQRLLPLERAILRTAASVVTINEHLADMLAAPSRPDIIPNCYDDRSIQVRDSHSIAHDCASFEIAYTGTIHSNHRYADFLDSIAALPARRENEPVIHFFYYGRSFQRLLPWKQTLCDRGIGLIDRGFVSVEECSQAQASSDLVLVFGWRGQGHRCVMTGKVFDYLATGRPVIAVTEHDTALGELVERTGAGVVLDTADEIAKFFTEMRTSPQNVLHSLERMRKPHVIREYSATEAAKKFESLLLDVVNSKSHRRIAQQVLS